MQWNKEGAAAIVAKSWRKEGAGAPFGNTRIEEEEETEEEEEE